MKHFFTHFIALLAMLTFSVCAMAGIRVTDAGDGMPVGGATVISKAGVILGITDTQGNFTNYNDRDFPLTIKCLGYEAAECPKGETEVRMATKDYQLPEYTVMADDHPIYRMVCLVREYMSGATPTDTLQFISSHIGDIYYKDKDKKIKGFKHADGKFRRLCTSTYERKTDNKGLDSISTLDSPSELSMVSILQIPTSTRNISNFFKNEETSDSVAGKFGTKLRMKKTPSYVSLQVDPLTDYKDHKLSPLIFKLLGMTIDITEAQTNQIYQNPGNNKLRPEELITGSVSMTAFAKGKIFKWIFHSSDPIEVNEYFEYYPISIEYLTAEEANDIYKNPPTYKLKDVLGSIPNLTPLPSSIESLVERAETQ